MADPEARHQDCWYARRTAEIPSDLGFHTIVDGQLLFCSHTMWFPVVGYQFDVRNCEACDYFRPRLLALRSAEGKPDTRSA